MSGAWFDGGANLNSFRFSITASEARAVQRAAVACNAAAVIAPSPLRGRGQLGGSSNTDRVRGKARPLTQRRMLSARRCPLPRRLRDSHIVLSPGKRVTDGHCGQLVPAGPHCLWAWRLIVAIPSAEASYDPGEP